MQVLYGQTHDSKISLKARVDSNGSLELFFTNCSGSLKHLLCCSARELKVGKTWKIDPYIEVFAKQERKENNLYARLSLAGSPDRPVVLTP